MKSINKLVYVISLGALLVGCSQSNLTIKEAELTDNEELLFSAIGKETYIFDLEGKIAKGKAMSVGVQEYNYGELKEDRTFLNLGRSVNDEDENLETYNKLFIRLKEDHDSEILVDVRVNSDKGFFSLTEASLGSILFDDRAYASDEIIGDDAVEVADAVDDKKTYIAQLGISPNEELRSFDVEHATQPNDDYEFLYLFYIETHDYEE